MGHCVGLVIESDIGPLSGSYRDSELPEETKAESMYGNLVSPMNS